MNKQKFSATFLILGVLCSVCLVVSNILAVKQFDIHLAGLTFPSTAGLLVFPIAYIINDCIAEVWGYRATRFVIWTAFAANFLVILLFQISVILPPSPHWTGMQPAYASVLAQTPRIAMASLLAFLTGSFINASIMSKMKVRYHGRYFGVRAIISTLFGELADTFLFTALGFCGVIPFETVIKIIITETIIKTLYEIVILPFTAIAVKRIKKSEGVDVFDRDISYNLFK
ncbi:MAG: queuosine precursor transporter [Prevotellaceae bacterium]|jgi:uncharacterized integral membrane protein (TIGR00697 family)|nr:queuosine precursor transporter [Prevotellaceae bacterium]